MSFDNKIKDLGIILPKAAAPVGSYVAAKLVGKLLFISGQISIDENGQLIKGKLGKDLKITAKSPDGVIEGIETTNEWNAIGIQWHPEYLDDEPTNKIYNWLIDS